MNAEAERRFDGECAPRIAAWIAAHLGAPVRVEVVARVGRGQPTRVRITGEPALHRRRYAHPLNVLLTWDGAEIERLFAPGGDERFERYLTSTSNKLHAWEAARPVDFATRTQGEPEILLGGLDFEG